jgi:hypothetical protein
MGETGPTVGSVGGSQRVFPIPVLVAVEVCWVLDAVLSSQVSWQVVNGSLAQARDARPHGENPALMVDLGEAEVDDPPDRSAHDRVPGS